VVKVSISTLPTLSDTHGETQPSGQKSFEKEKFYQQSLAREKKENYRQKRRKEKVIKTRIGNRQTAQTEETVEHTKKNRGKSELRVTKNHPKLEKIGEGIGLPWQSRLVRRKGTTKEKGDSPIGHPWSSMQTGGGKARRRLLQVKKHGCPLPLFSRGAVNSWKAQASGLKGPREIHHQRPTAGGNKYTGNGGKRGPCKGSPNEEMGQ